MKIKKIIENVMMMEGRKQGMKAGKKANRKTNRKASRKVSKKPARKKGMAMLLATACSMIVIGCLVFAGSSDFAPMQFDENGKLSFETIDNVAVRTAYRTLGWTIKKYDLPINDSNNLTVTCSLHDNSFVGADGKAHTFFYVNREEVLAKITEKSPEWAAELRTAGGVVYLDSIMTVCEYGRPRGVLYGNGSSSGEVYFTFDGISKARYWRNPNDLRQDYDRTVIVNADSDSYRPKGEIVQLENQTMGFNYVNDQISVLKKCSLYSNDYDAEHAIPSSESVNAIGEFSKYAYNLKYQKITGQRTYGVKVNVKTMLRWTDRSGNQKEEEVRYSKWYYADRQYCYYKITDFELYELSEWKFENAAAGSFGMSRNTGVGVAKIKKASVYDAEYVKEITIDAGTIYGTGNYRPTVPIRDYSGVVNMHVGNIRTESDSILIDGESILDAGGAKRPSRNESITFTKDNMKIAAARENGIATTLSKCSYRNYMDSEKKLELTVSGNPLTVHTPVVCMSDVKIEKTQNKLSFGVNISLNVKNEGQHNNVKGYGVRDYSKYVTKNQVQFPFDVLRDGMLIEKQKWIDIGKSGENELFSLKDISTKGEYKIEFRTLAINYEEFRPDFKELNFNKTTVNHCAYSAQTILLQGPEGQSDVRKYQIIGTH